MELSVDLVKQLREISMASLKDCKECLIEAQWDLTKAQELLKKKGIASAGKKGDRETKEWKIAYLLHGDSIAVLKLWCETDFVAKNELFDKLMSDILQLVITSKPVDSFDQLDPSLSEKVTTTIAELIGKLGENMKVAQLFVKKLPASHAYVYTHAGSKLLAIVYYNSLADDASDVVKKAALQIAAMDPTYLSIDSIPTGDLDAMKQECETEVRASWKPEAVIANIVAGKLNKKYSEIVLLEQSYVGDETQKIKTLIENKASIVSFDRIAFVN